MSLPEILRDDEIENLYRLSTRLYENTKDRRLDDDDFKNIISLNGGYGSGKTHFLRKFKKYVEQEKTIDGEKEKGNPQIVKLNIWEDDFADDPLIPILHTIAEHDIFNNLKYDLSFFIACVKGGFHLVNFALETFGIDIKDNIQEFFNFLSEDCDITIDNSENIKKGLFENFKKITDIKERYRQFIEKQQTSKKTVHNNLKKIDTEFFIKKQVIQLVKKCLRDTVLNTQKPFFILVDELDRCRPDYAVTTLERIKHIFNVAGLIFILAVDRKQLEHSVRHAFGADWDFDNYYLRFAPLEINLGKLSEKFPAKELLEKDIYNSLTDSIKEKYFFSDTDHHLIDTKIQEIFVRICTEAQLRPRALIHTIEKRDVLGLPKEYLIPMIFLSTNNQYRDVFYQIYIDNNFIINPKQQNIKNLFYNIMLPLNPLKDKVLDGRIIFDIFKLFFCFPKISNNLIYSYIDGNDPYNDRKIITDQINSLVNAILSKKTTNDYGSKIADYMQKDISFLHNAIGTYFDTIYVIVTKTNNFLEQHTTLKKHQSTLKALFEHYKPIEKEQ